MLRLKSSVDRSIEMKPPATMMMIMMKTSTNDTIPDSLKYDPDKFDIEFVIPKRRSRKQKEIKFFTQCNVVLADVHGVLLKPFHEADRENNVVHHVRHRNGDHFI